MKFVIHFCECKPITLSEFCYYPIRSLGYIYMYNSRLQMHPFYYKDNIRLIELNAPSQELHNTMYTVSAQVNAHVRVNAHGTPTWPVFHIDASPPTLHLGGWIHTASPRTHFMLFQTKWAQPKLSLHSFSGCFPLSSAMAASNEKHILGNCA